MLDVPPNSEAWPQWWIVHPNSEAWPQCSYSEPKETLLPPVDFGGHSVAVGRKEYYLSSVLVVRLKHMPVFSPS